MSTGLVKPKKLKLTDYEVFQTLGTGNYISLFKIKAHSVE